MTPCLPTLLGRLLFLIKEDGGGQGRAGAWGSIPIPNNIQVDFSIKMDTLHPIQPSNPSKFLISPEQIFDFRMNFG